uniref:Uncharacterized protein n=1 Tax=Anguilla anguilla TaxID=7936 RepID=A0A0E9Q230_ANGAN
MIGYIFKRFFLTVPVPPQWRFVALHL